MNFLDYLKPKGHLEISKVYKNGDEEVIFDEDNIILSGMSVGLSILYALSGSSNITDFQIDRFQVGVSGHTGNQVSSTFQLSGVLLGNEYGANTNLVVVSSSQIKNNSVVTNQAFGLIPFSKITRINDTTVRYTITLDENTANNLTGASSEDTSLSEIALAMKNPTGATPEESILVAYRSFTPVRKTTDFALVFRYSINF